MTEEAPRLYARFSRRFRAIAVDSVVYAASLMLIIVLLELVGGGRVRSGAIILGWLVFVMLYEPILVWRRGATLGHAYANIRVVAIRSGGNPGFLRAFGRFWLKGILGLLAFAFMGTTRRHQALHDLVFGTTVEIRDPSRATPYDYVTEREPDVSRVPAPGWRRVLVILAYSFVAFLLYAIVLVAAESGDCMSGNLCSPAEKVWEKVLALVWIGAQALVIVFGWQSRLLGARAAARTLALLAICVAPAFAQERSPASAYGVVEYTHMRLRKDNGTVQGASGSGVSLRLGMRPLSSTPRLLAEGAVTYIPESDDPFDGHPSVWGANLGALYAVSPLGKHNGPFNPFAALSVGFISYGDPPGGPIPCPPDECLDESPDLHGTKPSFAVGGGSWVWLGAGVGLRLDLRVHHRFGDSDDAEDAWSPEISAGAGYHF